ncbi:MAG: sugar ABC transporter permease [Actinobacteria bacterium]|nr:sugar ABC transporter permease [Actinomycetota bacterium]
MKIKVTTRQIDNIFGYIYVLPAVIFIIWVYFYPIFQNLRFSFIDLSIKGAPFVGLKNYISMVNDKVFFISLKNNLLLFLIVPVLVAISLIFSVLLYEKIKGWKVYRTFLFMPYILSITVVGIFFSFFFQFNGVLNTILRVLKLDFLVFDWLGKTHLALPTIMLVIIWRELGFGVVLFLARLMTVSEELYDAAKIDGAGWVQRLWYITIPQLSTVIEFYIFISLITMLSWVFNYVYVMTNGGPGYSSYISELYIYTQAFRQNDIGISAAVAIVLFAITAILAFLSYNFRKRLYAEYE